MHGNLSMDNVKSSFHILSCSVEWESVHCTDSHVRTDSPLMHWMDKRTLLGTGYL